MAIEEVSSQRSAVSYAVVLMNGTGVQHRDPR